MNEDNGFSGQVQSEPKAQGTFSVLDAVPPVQIRSGVYDEIGVYGISLQGRSHRSGDIPCQDSNDFCYLEQEKILIAVIADGVGSCVLSHWGAYTAVQAVILSLKREFAAISNGEAVKIGSLSAEQIEAMFNRAFDDARRAVEELADREQQMVYSFQSTLTAAIYDGSRLACCHIGDDGIVAQGTSGNYRMITQRIKGDTANSVVTLQSGKCYVTTISTDVTGFLMTTDGILDSYVLNQTYNDRVWYPFFQACVYSMEPKRSNEMAQAVEEAMNETKAQLLDDSVMGAVTDDMTVLAVANQRLLVQAPRPVFSQEEWDREIREIRRKQREKSQPRNDPPKSNTQSAPRPRMTNQQPAHKPKAGPQQRMQGEDRSILAIGFDDFGRAVMGILQGVDGAALIPGRSSRQSAPGNVLLRCPECWQKLGGREKYCPNCGRRLIK